MRFSTVTALSLATLAAASPLPSAPSAMPDWVCKVFDCSSFTAGSSSSGSTTVSSESWSSGSGTNKSSSSWSYTTPGATPKSTPTRSAYGSASAVKSSAVKSTATAAATKTPSSSTSTAAESTSDDSTNEWATLHNNYRAKHVDTGSLVWDADLAAGALEHSSACVFEHSDGQGAYGENLAMGTGLTASQTLDMWYGEIDEYGSYWGKEDVPMSVMHFTQVVWKGTTKVGCGMYDCPSGKLATCRYQEAGNMMGSFAANVGELA